MAVWKTSISDEKFEVKILIHVSNVLMCFNFMKFNQSNYANRCPSGVLYYMLQFYS